MNPALLLLLAILTPFLIATALLAPPYAGMVGAAYIVYDTGAAVHPLSGHLLDIFYMIDVYSKLFTYWHANMGSLSIMHYALPIVSLPLAGLLVALWLARKLTGKLMDLFHLSASHH
jgi:hypothetical protein